MSMWIVTIVGAVLFSAPCVARPVNAEVLTTVSRSAEFIPRYEIFELSFKHNATYNNSFFEVNVDVIFTSPGGVKHKVKGFFYGTDLWKARFRPDEVGRWSYAYTMNGKGGFHQKGDGVFDCTTSDAEGPVLRHPKNRYRWVFANGKPYFPVGLQDCVGVHGSQLRSRPIDGEKRTDNARQISQEDYFAIYHQAGFNLFRFSQNNCSYPLFDDLDHYREAESIATDELLSLARKHGFRVMLGFFGFYRSGLSESRPVRIFKRILQSALRVQVERPIHYENHEILSKEKRFIDYVVARWGVYVDFWELLNEREASDEWTTLIANYVRSVDPDRKPISTSWEKPHLPAIDINAPHWYESENELQSDLRVQQQAAAWKQPGKPVLVGEQGNTGMNWDPRSGVRMRIRTWTALFQEIGFVFWNTVWSKAGMFQGLYTPGQTANIYLGPEERGYIRILQGFSSRLDPGVRMVPVEVSFPDRVRAYGLVSARGAGIYLHHFENHTSAVHGAKITLDIPRGDQPLTELIGEWIEPSTGRALARKGLLAGRQTLEIPSFNVDLALLVTSER